MHGGIRQLFIYDGFNLIQIIGPISVILMIQMMILSMHIGTVHLGRLRLWTVMDQ